MRQRRLLMIAIPVVILLAIGAVLLSGKIPLASPLGEPKEAASERIETPAESTLVKLTPTQFDAAAIQTESLEMRSIHAANVLPGRVTYDETRHIEIKFPAEGTLRSILVQPGDKVAAGQIVARADCPDLGERRADFLMREAESRQAELLQARTEKIGENVRRLLDELAANPAPSSAEIAKKYHVVELGEHRAAILSAYAKCYAAQKILAKLRPLADQGVSSSRAILEQETAYELASAEFDAACEAARYGVDQAVIKSTLAAADAQRRRTIAEERLISLLVHGGNVRPSREELFASELGMWEVRAPFAGTVEEINAAALERLPADGSLMVIADTSVVWVEAEIREHDYADIPRQGTIRLPVEFPALPGIRYEGETAFVGRAQSNDTRAVPFVLRVANPDGKLRPGMFARAWLPKGETHSSAAVRRSAIASHEGKSFVFVAEGSSAFKRIDVELGIESEGWVELKTALPPDSRVATANVFVLKSMLLLEPEE